MQHDSDTRATAPDLPQDPAPGRPGLLPRLLRWLTWIAIGLGLLVPFGQWTWLGTLAGACSRFLILALLPGLIFFRREPVAAVLILIAMLCAAWPWMRQAWQARAPQQSAGAGAGVLAVNCAWWNQVDAGTVAAAIIAADADVLVISEASEDLVALLRRGGDWRYWHTSLCSDERGPYSIAIGSRLPFIGRERTIVIDGPTRSYRFESGGRSAFAGQAAIPLVRLELDGQPVLLAGIHAPPPTLPRLWRHQLAYFRRLIEALPDDTDLPVLLAGDFNAVPGGAVLQHLHRLGFRRVVGSSGNTWTWPGFTVLRPLLGLPIDHLLARRLALADARLVAVPGSDHMGVYTRIAHPDSKQ